MKLTKIKIKNFRLLEDVELLLEEISTVIVGRNNSGKTSLTELFRRLVGEKVPKFRLEDFSLCVLERFWSACELYRNDKEEPEIRQILPSIITELFIGYSQQEEYGPLAEFIIDLDEGCTTAQINIRYELAPGKMSQLFQDIGPDIKAFYNVIKDRIPSCYEVVVEAQDPNDITNKKTVDAAKLQALLQFGFINAQRALDDTTNKDKAVLGKIFERLFIAASAEKTNPGAQTTVNTLTEAVSKVQNQIDEDFNNQLSNLLPAFDLFGYPGLKDPKLCTETLLDVKQLLSNHTTVGYLGTNGVNLPESYNGLGPRNLIFILLKLYEYFKEYAIHQPSAGVHLIFIEEPEAHLHPQMQTVFIRKLGEISNLFANKYNNDKPWPVQFVVTSHSPHIANEASLDSIRYFLTQQRNPGLSLVKTVIKDIRTGLSSEVPENRTFIHKYMTITRCDLLFADKAILIEGTTERLLLPVMIRKHDETETGTQLKLGSQYLTIMEVGGAYAHCFFKLLDFLDLKTLIITDIDTVKAVAKTDKKGRQVTTFEKCMVSEGGKSSNGCIKDWLKKGEETEYSITELIALTDEKIHNKRRLAYQIPHTDGDACGRSFEDAFILANARKFLIVDPNPIVREKEAYEKAKELDKIDFALKYAVTDNDWATPRYIEEGIKWLANNDVPTQKVRRASKPMARPRIKKGKT